MTFEEWWWNHARREYRNFSNDVASEAAWIESKKQTEQRVVDDVDVIFRHLANDDCTIAYAIDKFKELKQKFGVKDENMTEHDKSFMRVSAENAKLREQIGNMLNDIQNIMININSDSSDFNKLYKIIRKKYGKEKK